MNDSLGHPDVSISNLVRRAFNLFISNFNKFVILAIPVALAQMIFQYATNQKVISLSIDEDPYKGLIVFFVSLLVYLLIIFIAEAALYNSAYYAYINHPGEAILDSVKKGFKRFLPFLGLTLLFSVIVTLIMLLILIPVFIAFPSLVEQLGLQDSPAITPGIITAVLIIFALIIVLILIFGVPFSLFAAPHICVKEKCGVFEALNESFKKIRGMRLNGFAYLIIIILIQLAFALVLFLVAFLILTLFNRAYIIEIKDIILRGGTDKLNYFVGLISGLMSIITVPFNISAATVFYRELNRGEEIATPPQCAGSQ